MTKLSSYQKVKLENKRLKQDIFNLVKKRHEWAGIETTAKYEMMFEAESIIMSGSRTPANNSALTGIGTVIIPQHMIPKDRINGDN